MSKKLNLKEITQKLKNSFLRLKPNTIQIYRCLSNGFKVLPGCYWSSNYKEISWGKWLISLTTDLKTGIKR